MRLGVPAELAGEGIEAGVLERFRDALADAQQLDAEVQGDSWLIEDPAPEDVFTSDPEGLWSAVVRRKGRAFSMLALMPASRRARLGEPSLAGCQMRAVKARSAAAADRPIRMRSARAVPTAGITSKLKASAPTMAPIVLAA